MILSRFSGRFRYAVLTKEEAADKARTGHTWAPTFDHHLFGRLVLTIGKRWGSAGERHFANGDRQKLEKVLGRAILAIEGYAVALNKRDEEQAARRKEEVWRAALRATADGKAAHEKDDLTDDLMQMASAWSRAREIWAFLSAVVERVPAAEMDEGWRKWLEWAERCADKLDPLSEPDGMGFRSSSNRARRSRWHRGGAESAAGAESNWEGDRRKLRAQGAAPHAPQARVSKFSRASRVQVQLRRVSPKVSCSPMHTQWMLPRSG